MADQANDPFERQSYPYPQPDKFPFRTIILAIIFLPVIAYLGFYAIKKSTESEKRARQCQEQCTQKGHAGYEFKWTIFSGPVCQCIQ